MENSRFVQRPGGLGPQQRLQPLGGMAAPTPPAAYMNSPLALATQRILNLDDVNRVQAQYETDRGDGKRSALQPVPYGEGNIVSSNQVTGVAGYNHRDALVLPERPEDMTKEAYLVKASNTMDPNLRTQMRILTMYPQQNFMNTQDPTVAENLRSYTMPDSLYMPNPEVFGKKK